MIPCGKVMPFMAKTPGYEVPLPIGAMLPLAHVRMAPYLVPYLRASESYLYGSYPRHFTEQEPRQKG